MEVIGHESGRSRPGRPDAARTSIWLIEDEQLVGRLMRSTLEDSGFAVRWFVTGEAALEAAREGPRADLLLTDISLPGLSGLQVAHELTRDWPGLPVLVTSGFLHDVRSRDGALPEEYEYLPKPFTPRVLLERLSGMGLERSA